jgi:hypothetical protein
MRYISTLEVREGQTRELVGATWAGFGAKPRLVAVA